MCNDSDDEQLPSGPGDEEASQIDAPCRERELEGDGGRASDLEPQPLGNQATVTQDIQPRPFENDMLHHDAIDDGSVRARATGTHIQPINTAY